MCKEMLLIRIFKKTLYSFALFALLLSLNSGAGEALFGVEFEFQNEATMAAADEGKASKAVKAYQASMLEKIKSLCEKRGNCTVTESLRRWGQSMDYVITYSDGWSWRLSTDPGTVEIQTAPTTIEKYTEMADRIQTDIFGVAEASGLHASKETGSGHIHIGVESAFQENPLHVRNFIVDQVNHSELALGIFEEDISNAPPLSELTAKQKHAFREVIQEFDDGKIKTLVELTQSITSRVYYANLSGWTPTEKYQNINLTRINRYAYDFDRQTIEIRAFKAQSNVEEFLKEITLLQKRIDFLQKNEGRVALVRSIVSPKDELEAARRFYQFVTETELKWDDYKQFVKTQFK